MQQLRAISHLFIITSLLSTGVALAAPQELGAVGESAPFAILNTSKPGFSIAAVVGEEAVSSYDVENRIRFIVATARISNTPDVLKVIRPQVIRTLVDERLQIQEAKKNNISISEKDVPDAIASIEKDRGMPAGTISSMLGHNNVPKETFESQIRAQLLWNKLLIQRVRPGVHISEEELQAAARRYSMLPPPPKKTAPIPQEYKISIIALPVEKASQENNIKALAFKLVQQIRNGASFEEVSRQFSSVSKNAGGVIESFWVRPSQLDAQVAQALGPSEKGAVTNPVRTSQGYTIIKIYDTRPLAGAKPKPAPKEEEEVKDTEITLKEILLKLKPDAAEQEGDVMLQIGSEVAKNPGTCENTDIAGIADTENMEIEVKFNKYMLSEMSPNMKEMTDKLMLGNISAPAATYEGVRLYMLCDKKPALNKPVNKDVVYGMLIQQKMDLEAQKYMRNLRRETFIDIRQ